MTFDQKVRNTLWKYISPEVADCVGISFGQLRLFLSNGTGLSDAEIEKLARRVNVGA